MAPFEGNPEAFVETKTNENPHPVFSLDGLIWWLERQPGETTYDWFSCEDCLYHRYLQSRGNDGSESYQAIRLVIGPWIGCGGKQRYAAALDRAKALKAHP